ncbi:hypothetical protein DVH24_038941 [Malus domestica]|uniref:TIR domain-containing protein n=1 Tax=Malus domestica TaxID=3750 RepID=A0A498KBC7_MALDO|nr:hypothetical protein DVH24_038941 [Malus domestica]
MECITPLLHMCCRLLTFSSLSSAGAGAVGASAADDIDADNPPRRDKYDVFISFRGEDTRLNITSHLHAALLQRKIETYIDYILQRGEEIGPALLEAIEKSTLSVIIFSQNYASSTWCLDELVHILKCKEKSGQIVIPIFYDINPSDVRQQRRSYADAFAQFEKRFNDSIDKVQKWRDALTTAANLSGFDHSQKSSRSGILGIPDGFVCTTSLRDLDLSRSMIRSLPASIKQASQLSTLCLIGCKWLQSLPELPVVRLLQAHGCTSLKTVSSSRTIHYTQGWDKYEYFGELDFSNCRNLDHNARSNIMDDAQLRIMQVAIASSKLREKEEEEEDDDDDADGDDDHEYYSYWPLVSIVCPGKEIPNWFSYQSEESSVVIELRQDWFRTGLLGFALAVVVSWELNCQLNWMVRASFNVKFKGESHEMFTSEFDIRQASWKLNDYCYGQHHVYLWNEAFKSEVVAKKCSPDFCNLANDASVEFCLVDEDSGEPTSYMKVEKCGVCPLYVEDAERFKYGHVIVRGITEAKRASSCIETALAIVPGESKEEEEEEEEERRHDNFEANEPETNGSGDESEEEASGSGDESEEKASGSGIDNNTDLLVRQSYRETSLMDLKQMHIKSLKPTSHAVPRPYYFSPRYNVEF